MTRAQARARVHSLDPAADCQEIVALMGRYLYGWETTRALELALFRTYGSPSISALLDRTGEFALRGQKRYDDTALIMAEIMEHGFDSERGRAALRRMNQMHGRFAIPNEDFLYVLSTFVLEPMRWSRWLSPHPWTPHERQAAFNFWLEVGRRMNIQDIPPTLEALERWSLEYEERHFVYADTNRRVADATVAIFMGWFPTALHPLLRPAVYALLDDRLREALGYPKQPAWLTGLLLKSARLRAWAGEQLPVRPYEYTTQRHRSYPQGYTVEQLGADREGRA